MKYVVMMFVQPSLRDYFVFTPTLPAMNDWAIINRPYGTFSTASQVGDAWHTNNPCPHD